MVSSDWRHGGWFWGVSGSACSNLHHAAHDVCDALCVNCKICFLSQAMVDICAEAGWLSTALNAMHLVQALLQARFHRLPCCFPQRPSASWVSAVACLSYRRIRTLRPLAPQCRHRHLCCCTKPGGDLSEAMPPCHCLRILPRKQPSVWTAQDENALDSGFWRLCCLHASAQAKR